MYGDMSDDDGGETSFTVTLMLTDKGDDSFDDFVPQPPDSINRSAEGTSVLETNNNGRVISKDEQTPNSRNKIDSLNSQTNEIQDWKRRAETAERLVIELVEERNAMRRVSFTQELLERKAGPAHPRRSSVRPFGRYRLHRPSTL